jgi:hypothetical protein
MKRPILMLALVGLLLSGCSGVRMDARHSALLDTLVAMTEKDATLALQKKMDPNDMASALVTHHSMAKQLQNERDGVDGGLPKPE